MSFWFLYGDDSFLIADRLRVLKAERVGVELAVFEGKVDLSLVTDFLSNVSMFCVGKCAVLKSPSFLYGEVPDGVVGQLERLREVASGPSSVIVVAEKSVDMRRVVGKWLKKNAIAEELTGFKEWEREKIKGFLSARFKKAGLGCGADVLDFLVDLYGTDLRALDACVTQLRVYLGAVTQVGMADAKAVCQKGNVSIYDFLEMLKGGRAEAGAMLMQLLDEGEEPVMLIGLLMAQFRLFYELLELSSKRMSGEDIAKRVGKHPFYVKKVLESVSRAYTLERVGKAIVALRDADIAIKTGKMRPRVALEVAVLPLFSSK